MEHMIIFELDYVPDDMSVEKDAKIFEAGEYPDKGISVGEEDLDAIIGNFEEVPVKIEHVDSPLDPLGTVKRIWRQGRDLFARLAFPEDLAAFLQRRGVKRLSVALHKDPLRLAEVSLVLSPRVADAAMFGRTAESNPQSGGEVNVDMSDRDTKDKEIEELRFALRAKDVDAKVAHLKAEGKLVPASEQYAREIMLRGDEKITFGESETTIAFLFECFLENQPKVLTFGETTPGVRSPDTPLSAEEEEVLAKLGITREQLQRYKDS